jgi:hypothetical protein
MLEMLPNRWFAVLIIVSVVLGIIAIEVGLKCTPQVVYHNLIILA